MIRYTSMPETDQDFELVERFKRGDSSAFDALFDRHIRGVRSLVVRTIGQEAADDVTQEVFVQVFRSLGRFRGKSSLRTWIYAITMNQCRDHIRHRSRQPSVSFFDDTEEMFLTEQVSDPMTRLTLTEIERAISLLSEAERAAVELHYVQGLSYSEMAKVFQCPTGTIKARIHSAIAKLRRKLRHLEVEVHEQ